MLSDFPITEIDADEMEQRIAELEDVIAPRLPGRRQLHGVLSHSSTRLSDLYGMQPVSDPAVKCEQFVDERLCVIVTLCDRWLTVSACVSWLNTKHDICSIVYYFTQHPMHHNTVKSSIAGKVSQKRSRYVSTAKNTETHTIMSTEPTDGTL